MKNADLRRIKITGKDIKGVNLREIIKEIAEGKTGFVRNHRDREIVEIICKLEDADEIKKVLDGWKEKKKDFTKIDSIEITEDFFDDEDFKEGCFEIKREDDLHEMVWALRGAGKVFTDLEKARVIGLIEGLKIEINRISDWLSGLSPDKQNNEYTPKSLENFIIQHPVPSEEKDIFDKLAGLEEFCNKINSWVKQGIIAEKLKKPEEQKEIENVIKEIDPIREQLDKLKMSL